MSGLTRNTKPVYRWSVASRALAAIAGGYALTSLIVLLLSLALPWVGVSQAEAVLASTILSFLIYTAIIMAVFHARSAGRAWALLIGAGVPLGLVVWLLLPGAIS